MYYNCLLHNQIKNNGVPISNGKTTLFKFIHVLLCLFFIISLLFCICVYFFYSLFLLGVFSLTIDNFFLIILDKPLFLLSFIITLILGFIINKHRLNKTFFTIKVLDSTNCLMLLTDKKYIGVEYKLELCNILNIRYSLNKDYYEVYCKNLEVVKNKNSKLIDCLLVCSGTEFRDFILDLRDTLGFNINIV